MTGEAGVGFAPLWLFHLGFAALVVELRHLILLFENDLLCNLLRGYVEPVQNVSRFTQVVIITGVQNSRLLSWTISSVLNKISSAVQAVAEQQSLRLQADHVPLRSAAHNLIELQS